MYIVSINTIYLMIIEQQLWLLFVYNIQWRFGASSWLNYSIFEYTTGEWESRKIDNKLFSIYFSVCSWFGINGGGEKINAHDKPLAQFRFILKIKLFRINSFTKHTSNILLNILRLHSKFKMFIREPCTYIVSGFFLCSFIFQFVCNESIEDELIISSA